jgi:hypothetical protein
MDRVRVRLLPCLVYLVLTLPFATLAQTSAPVPPSAPLTPEGQQAVREGDIAAQQQNYELAIRHFQDARTLAPGNPDVYKDLASAESKIPGHELRAAAWFGAYLAANPNAQDAAEVKEQIATLEAKSRSEISRLIASMQDAASQAGEHQAFQLGQIAGLWAETGDMTAAMKAADSIQDAHDKNGALVNIAERQVIAGDIAGAQKTADLIPDAYLKSVAEKTIADAQVAIGDIAGAQKTADLIQDAYWRSAAQKTIADRQAGVGSMNNSAAVANSTDWINILDNKYGEFTLDAGPFVDRAGYLTSLYTGDPLEDFYTLYSSVEELVKAQNVVDKMLKQQAG